MECGPAFNDPTNGPPRFIVLFSPSSHPPFFPPSASPEPMRLLPLLLLPLPPLLPLLSLLPLLPLLLLNEGPLLLSVRRPRARSVILKCSISGNANTRTPPTANGAYVDMFDATRDKEDGR